MTCAREREHLSLVCQALCRTYHDTNLIRHPRPLYHSLQQHSRAFLLYLKFFRSPKKKKRVRLLPLLTTFACINQEHDRKSHSSQQHEVLGFLKISELCLRFQSRNRRQDFQFCQQRRETLRSTAQHKHFSLRKFQTQSKPSFLQQLQGCEEDQSRKHKVPYQVRVVVYHRMYDARFSPYHPSIQQCRQKWDIYSHKQLCFIEWLLLQHIQKDYCEFPPSDG